MKKHILMHFHQYQDDEKKKKKEEEEEEHLARLGHHCFLCPSAFCCVVVPSPSRAGDHISGCGHKNTMFYFFSSYNLSRRAPKAK